jgi:hypothetical protein
MLSFRHQLVRDAIYEDIPQAVRIGLHRQAATALEAAGAPIAQVTPNGRDTRPRYASRTRRTPAKDLLEVIDDRSQLRSTVVDTQVPVEDWHTALTAGDPTLADAILDRLVHNAHRLSLRGSSLRRRQPPPADESAAS